MSISRVSFSSGNVASLKFTESLELIKELVDKNVWVYHATTLTHVCLDVDTFDSLEETLASTLPHCSSVSITLLDNNSYIPPSLKINIIIERDGNRRKRSEYSCLFTSLSSDSNKDIGSSVKLPLLCVLNRTTLAPVVHSAFETIFGCIISSIPIDQIQLKWLIGISVNEIIKRDLDTEFTLMFDIQPEMHMKCNLPYGELHYLWSCCKTSNNSKLSVHQVENFIKMLTSHFENASKVRVSWFKMVKFLLSQITVSTEKELQLNCSLHPLLYCILSYIETDLM